MPSLRLSYDLFRSLQRAPVIFLLYFVEADPGNSTPLLYLASWRETDGEHILLVTVAALMSLAMPGQASLLGPSAETVVSGLRLPLAVCMDLAGSGHRVLPEWRTTLGTHLLLADIVSQGYLLPPFASPPLPASLSVGMLEALAERCPDDYFLALGDLDDHYLDDSSLDDAVPDPYL